MKINKVYKNANDTIPLTPQELANEVNLLGFNIPSSYYPDRINGDICKCKEGGEFVLLPIEHESVQEGEKRYMICKECGISAHL